MSGVGCSCGWPLDSCNPTFATNQRCGKQVHEEEQDEAYRKSDWGLVEEAISSDDITKALKLLLKICKDQQTQIDNNRPDPRLAFIGG